MGTSTTIVLYWTAFVYHFLLASEISMLGTSIPLLMEFAKSLDMHPLLLGMIWTFSAGGKLFAYQSGVLIVVIHTDISRRAIWCVWAHASPS